MVDAVATRSILFPVVSLTLLGALMRVPHLIDPSIQDEQTTLRRVRSSALEIVTEYDAANNHPLYNLLAHACLALGDSLTLMRVPALCAGLATLPLLWQLVERRAGRRPATWATLALALSSPHVIYSARARGYSLMVLGGVCSLWLFLRAIERNRLQTWASYTLVTALAVYAHLWGVLVLVGECCFALIELLRARYDAAEDRISLRSARIRAGVFPLIAGALALSLYSPMLPEIIAMVREPRELALAPELLAVVIWLMDFGIPEANLPLWGVSVMTVGIALLRHDLVRDALGRLVLITMACALAMVILLRPANLYPRFLMFLLPCYCCLIGLSLGALETLRSPAPGDSAWRRRLDRLSASLQVLAALFTATSVALLWLWPNTMVLDSAGRPWNPFAVGIWSGFSALLGSAWCGRSGKSAAWLRLVSLATVGLAAVDVIVELATHIPVRLNRLFGA
jgi:hypothetical protein